MEQTEKDRIFKLIGMFGSDFDNERSIAAKKIHEIAKLKKITIVELMKNCFEVKNNNNHQYKKTYQQYKREEPKYEYKEPEIEGKKEFLFLKKIIEKNGDKFLNDWEKSFIASLDHHFNFYGSRAYGLTSKQMYYVQQIIYKYGNMEKEKYS